VDDLVVHGSPEACRERVAEYQACGLNTPVIALVTPPGGEVAGLVRELGR
jgi:alkanesulfonate monooxygenase SsuD/methylene tetrahydromethanopterin reductase-like flavin-dependent oxidoreductase (luciferase family)